MVPVDTVPVPVDTVPVPVDTVPVPVDTVPVPVDTVPVVRYLCFILSPPTLVTLGQGHGFLNFMLKSFVPILVNIS